MVDPDKHLQTVDELFQAFGALSQYPGLIRGGCQDSGIRYEDLPIRVAIDLPDTPENRSYFAELKEVLKD